MFAGDDHEQYSAQLNKMTVANLTNAKRGYVLTQRGLAYKQQRKYEQAAADFEAAAELLLPGDEAFYTAELENGTFHHLRGDFNKAEEHFKAALKEKPHSLFAKV